MSIEQVIKALECCSGIAKCIDCPYTEVDKCAMQSAKDALALIKNQLGEIRGLNSAIETLQGVAKDYENHNENLKRENKYLRESLADEREHKEDCFFSVDLDIKALKADTVKKMQEKLKAEKFTHKNFGELVYVEGIDQIAKEILEGTK